MIKLCIYFLHKVAKTHKFDNALCFYTPHSQMDCVFLRVDNFLMSLCLPLAGKKVTCMNVKNYFFCSILGHGQ